MHVSCYPALGEQRTDPTCIDGLESALREEGINPSLIIGLTHSHLIGGEGERTDLLQSLTTATQSRNRCCIAVPTAPFGLVRSETG
jgi:hypothetical protein